VLSLWLIPSAENEVGMGADQRPRQFEPSDGLAATMLATFPDQLKRYAPLAEPLDQLRELVSELANPATVITQNHVDSLWRINTLIREVGGFDSVLGSAEPPERNYDAWLLRRPPVLPPDPPPDPGR
jgi:hypothetical protein